MMDLWLVKSGGVPVAVVMAADATTAVDTLVTTTGGRVGGPWRKDALTATRIGEAADSFALQTDSPLVLVEGWQAASSAAEAALFVASRAYAVDPRMVYGPGRRRHPSAVRARWAAWLVLTDDLHLSHSVCAGAVGADTSTVCDSLAKARALLKAGDAEFNAAVAAARMAVKSFRAAQVRKTRVRSRRVDRATLATPAPMAESVNAAAP